jgi:Gpi18-like mannosyltransferase
VLRPFFVSRRAMDARVIIVMTAVALLSYALLYTSDAIQSRSQAFLCAALIAAAFFIRGLMLDCRTSDFLNFLNDWVAFFARHGGLAGLSFSVGNYNIPYLYYLAVFSGSTIDDLYLIKILSICFDVILAWSGMRLAGLFVKSPGRRLACFFGILFLPTVVINGALWGQCDSIYTAFAVLGLYLGLSRRPWGSVICIALSFAFKLQAVFVMPVYALLLMSGRIKPKHLLAFPAAYIVSVLPAVIAGRPFWDTLTLYFNQASSVGEGLNYNSSSIFSLISSADTELWSGLAVGWSFLFVLAVLYAAFRRRGRLGKRACFAAAVLFSVAIPFLLPHMHDRYFFCADVLTLILAMVSPEAFAMPILVQFGSLLGYYAYFNMRYLMPMSVGGIAVLAAAVMAGLYYNRALGPVRRREKIAETQ